MTDHRDEVHEIVRQLEEEYGSANNIPKRPGCSALLISPLYCTGADIAIIRKDLSVEHGTVEKCTMDYDTTFGSIYVNTIATARSLLETQLRTYPRYKCTIIDQEGDEVAIAIPNTTHILQLRAQQTFMDKLCWAAYIDQAGEDSTPKNVRYICEAYQPKPVLNMYARICSQGNQTKQTLKVRRTRKVTQYSMGKRKKSASMVAPNFILMSRHPPRILEEEYNDDMDKFFIRVGTVSYQEQSRQVARRTYHIVPRTQNKTILDRYLRAVVVDDFNAQINILYSILENVDDTQN
jgi:hypothetical protein